MTDPIKAVTMLCGGTFEAARMWETIRRKADLILNSSIGQQCVGRAGGEGKRQSPWRD